MDARVTVTTLLPADAGRAAALHHDVLGAEFITRAGPRFLRRYYLAWIRSDSGVALAARLDGQVIGALLGSTRPSEHYRSMLRRDGWRLGALMLGRALAHPGFGAELFLSRGMRYSRALLRMGRSRLTTSPTPSGPYSPSAPASSRSAIGEVTHVLVDPAHQGKGAARALLAEAEERAGRAGLDGLVLVTTPELARSGLYERLGWTPRGQLTSGSGEEFWRYERDVSGRA